MRQRTLDVNEVKRRIAALIGIGDPSILLPEDEEAQTERICPVCHVNTYYMRFGVFCKLF